MAKKVETADADTDIRAPDAKVSFGYEAAALGDG